MHVTRRGIRQMRKPCGGDTSEQGREGLDVEGAGWPRGRTEGIQG